MSLADSKTLDNLKAAFAGESQANRRYLYFAQKADIEGYNDVATVSAPLQKVRPDTRTAIWNIWKKLVTRPLVNQLVQQLTT